MNTLSIISDSPEQTQMLGRYIGKLAAGGEIFLLHGNLGAGKTCLIQGIAFGLEVKEYASSPSFMIAREYQGRLKLNHLDLYRLNDLEEILDLGLDDYFSKDAVCAIEWAERGSEALPLDNMHIDLEHISDNGRKITFHPTGRYYIEFVSRLKNKLQTDKEVKWNFQ